MANDTVLILNPTAGSADRDGRQALERVERYADMRDGVRLRRTSGEGDAERWASEAADEGVEVVAAAGGDGTIAEVARGLLAHSGSAPPALGIIPLGTGNDLAGGLGIPAGVDEALEVLSERRIRRMDILQLRAGQETRPVINALTGGFSGQLHGKMDSDVKRTWGPLAYLRSGVEAWGERSLHRIHLTVDGEDRGEHEVLNLIVANGPRAGGGVPVAPGADAFDGRFDVILLEDSTPLELSALAAAVLAGEPEDHEAFRRFSGTRVHIHAEGLPVSIDGEPDRLDDFEIVLSPSALPVVVPG